MCSVYHASEGILNIKSKSLKKCLSSLCLLQATLDYVLRMWKVRFIFPRALLLAQEHHD